MQIIKQFRFSPNGYSVFTFNPGDEADPTDPAIAYGLKIGAVVNSNDVVNTKPQAAQIEAPKALDIDNKAIGDIAKPGRRKTAK